MKKPNTMGRPKRIAKIKQKASAIRIKRTREKLMRLKRYIDRVYPKPEKMGFRIWLERFIWRNTPRVGFLKSKAPIYTTDYLNFYRWVFLNTAKAMLKTKRKRPVIIAIGGVAGSGKTTLANRLAYATLDIFEPLGIKVRIISLDGYFKPREKTEIKDARGWVIKVVSKINGRVIPGEFDNPQASYLNQALQDLKSLREGKSVVRKLWDVKRQRFEETKLEPADVIIVEGLYTLHRPFAKIADIRIGLLTSLGNQLLVRSSRDIQERGRNPTDVARKFVSREILQRDFVLADVRKNAEIILETGAKPLSGPELEKWFLAERGNIQYYNFLRELGLSEAEGKPSKSKTMQELLRPGKSKTMQKPLRKGN